MTLGSCSISFVAELIDATELQAAQEKSGDDNRTKLEVEDSLLSSREAAFNEKLYSYIASDCVGRQKCAH